MSATSKAKKVYVTVNTVFEQREADRMWQFLQYLERVGPDGIIVQDLGVAKMAREHFPKLALHASTQMNVASAKGVNLLSRRGFKRAVLARELSLDEIRAVRAATQPRARGLRSRRPLRQRVGALPLLELPRRARAPTAGACAQACRRLYANDAESGYWFSPDDLQLIEYVPDLMEAGVESFKIEGRMKSAEYVGSVVAAYRHMIDNWKLDRERALAKAQAILQSDFARRKTTLLLRRQARPRLHQAPSSPAAPAFPWARCGTSASSTRARFALLDTPTTASAEGDSLRFHRPDDSERFTAKVREVQAGARTACSSRDRRATSARATRSTSCRRQATARRYKRPSCRKRPGALPQVPQPRAGARARAPGHLQGRARRPCPTGSTPSSAGPATSISSTRPGPRRPCSSSIATNAADHARGGEGAALQARQPRPLARPLLPRGRRELARYASSSTGSREASASSSPTTPATSGCSDRSRAQAPLRRAAPPRDAFDDERSAKRKPAPSKGDRHRRPLALRLQPVGRLLLSRGGRALHRASARDLQAGLSEALRSRACRLVDAGRVLLSRPLPHPRRSRPEATTSATFTDRDGSAYELVTGEDRSVVTPMKPFSIVDRIPFLRKEAYRQVHPRLLQHQADQAAVQAGDAGRPGGQGPARHRPFQLEGRLLAARGEPRRGLAQGGVAAWRFSRQPKNGTFYARIARRGTPIEYPRTEDCLAHRDRERRERPVHGALRLPERGQGRAPHGRGPGDSGGGEAEAISSGMSTAPTAA